MSDPFYRAFEDKYRGSRQEIQKRLEVYLPFVMPLARTFPQAQAIDLGCGRGEWLELLAGHKVPAHGIDLDQGMLDACADLGLQVYTSDAIEHLEKQASESAVVITAFHLVEHLGFESLRQLVFEAQRVLKPGGLLIMETPNPENIAVATKSFYLDPSHERPIPSELLSFLAEYHGYQRIKVLRLQENQTLLSKSALTLNDVLGGASPDYAVVAQKTAPSEVLQLLSPIWDKTYGVSSETLAEIYRHQKDEKDAQYWGLLNQAREQVEGLKVQEKDLQDRQHATQATLQATIDHLGNVSAQHEQTRQEHKQTRENLQAAGLLIDENRRALNEIRVSHDDNRTQQDETRAMLEATRQALDATVARLQQTQMQVAQIESRYIQELAQVYASKSWRITTPLRWANLQRKRLVEQGLRKRLKALVKKVARYFLQSLIRHINARPQWRQKALIWSLKLGLYERLRRLHHQVNAVVHSPPVEVQPAPCESQDLSPHARDIHEKLKQAIQKQVKH